MPKKTANKSNTQPKPGYALMKFRQRLKDGYTEKGAKIALTHMVNNGTMSEAEGKAAARALKKTFGG